MQTVSTPTQKDIFKHPPKDGKAVLTLVEAGKGNTAFRANSKTRIIIALQNPLVKEVYQRVADKRIFQTRRNGEEIMIK